MASTEIGHSEILAYKDSSSDVVNCFLYDVLFVSLFISF